MFQKKTAGENITGGRWLALNVVRCQLYRMPRCFLDHLCIDPVLHLIRASPPPNIRSIYYTKYNQGSQSV